MDTRGNLKTSVNKFVALDHSDANAWRLLVFTFEAQNIPLVEKIESLEVIAQRSNFNPFRLITLINTLPELCKSSDELIGLVLPLYLKACQKIENQYSKKNKKLNNKIQLLECQFIITMTAGFLTAHPDLETIFRICNFSINNMSMIRQITKTAEINPNFSGNFMSLLYHCIRNTESPPDPGNLYQIFRGNDQFYKTLALSTKGVKSYFYILAGLASNRKKADRITHILQKNKVLPHFPYSSYLLQFSKLVLHLHKRGADRNSIRDLLSMLKIEIIKDRRSKKISFTDCLLKHHRIHYGQVIFMLADHGLFHPEEYRPEMAEPVFNYIKSLKETERASTLHAILIPSGQTQLHLIFWKMKRKPQFFKGYEAVLPKEWSAKITHELALIEAVNKTTNILFAKHDHHVEPLDESQESHNIALFSY